MALTKNASLNVVLPALLMSGSLALSLVTRAVADDVPELNIEPTSHGIAQQAGLRRKRADLISPIRNVFKVSRQ
jgi:hypothetical protein